MWNYLIITASNDDQAAGYRAQLDLRLRLGLLPEVQNVLVVADPGGRRVGSGGSTLCCLMEVLQRHLGNRAACMETYREILSSLRILIIHAGGDSKRLPAYGPCGKIFVPVPGESDSCLPVTLFDRQLATYLALPVSVEGAGQVVITSGDVMLRFDPTQVCFNKPGLTGLGCYADPRQAAHHGVYCGAEANRVKRFLQKPTPEQQAELGATDHYGQSVLDIGVMSFDADTAARLLEVFGVCSDNTGRLALTGDMGQAVIERGLDFYREVCCGMGSEVTSAHHIQMARGSGSSWDDALLKRLLQGLGDIDFNLELLRQCDFIDFGTTRHIIRSGVALTQQDRGAPCLNPCLDINNEILGNGQLIGSHCWVESCRVSAPLTLDGENVVVGVDVDQPLSLPTGACLDVIAGYKKTGQSDTSDTWFIRCYGVDDTFKDTNGTLCGRPILEWLDMVGASSEDVWDQSIKEDQRSVWDARVFPAVSSPDQYRDWLWMYTPEKATEQQLINWHKADRYSLAEIAQQTNQEAFFQRRLAIRAKQIKNSLRRFFRRGGEFSAAEFAHILNNTNDQPAWIAALLSEAKWHYESGKGLDMLVFPRIIHTLATVLEELANDKGSQLNDAVPGLAEIIDPAEIDWLDSLGLNLNSGTTVGCWVKRARSIAFDSLGKAIIFTGADKPKPPVSRLRSDEIVWGRAPARFDTGGGWTDTPPYSLEYGGCVVNTAVNLNGQAPIQAYMRVTDEPVITIGSIDLGTRVTISDLSELLDYSEPTSKYGLVKAALALSGFSPETAAWPEGTTLTKMLESFGGGIEITTLAAIPKGSGLGTSSIMGAVILAVIRRVMGQTLTQKELFNQVLQLEQALTTGGGWQDQVGGAVGGVKIVYADSGLVPDTRIHYLPSDIIDPATNGGMTLLYYTGITRLAKNILEQVVGRYLDRNRSSMMTLRKIEGLTSQVAEALSRKDLPEFGRLVDCAWQLNKQLDPNSTNDQVEQLFARVKSHVYGAKLLGAGGGGFMLMVCKSQEDAREIRTKLQTDPPNDRSRFFDFNVNTKGLIVTVC